MFLIKCNELYKRCLFYVMENPAQKGMKFNRNKRPPPHSEFNTKSPLFRKRNARTLISAKYSTPLKELLIVFN